MIGAVPPTVPTLTTERLVLRPWRTEDREPFAALNADPVTMDRLPTLLSREESDAFADRIEATLGERGWGLWAVEIPDRAAFAGFVGLNVPGFEADFTPCVEIGWRLHRDHWGHGYATEGARAVLDHAFTVVGLDEVVSFTSVGHDASRHVMEKIGLRRVGEFDHPRLADHRLERHVLYRLAAADHHPAP